MFKNEFRRDKATQVFSTFKIYYEEEEIDTSKNDTRATTTIGQGFRGIAWKPGKRFYMRVKLIRENDVVGSVIRDKYEPFQVKGGKIAKWLF